MVPPLLNHITCNQREYTVRRTITLKEFNKPGGIKKKNYTERLRTEVQPLKLPYPLKKKKINNNNKIIKKIRK